MNATIGIDASRAIGRRRTGTEQYSARLIEALAALAPPEAVVLYVNASIPPKWDLTPSFRFRPLPWPRGWSHIRLSAELAVRRPDVLFVPAHVVPLYHPPTVVTIHDIGYRDFPAAHTAVSRFTLEWTTRWSEAAARHVITPSQHTADALSRSYGTPRAKLTVIPHGYDPRFRPLDPAVVRAGLERLGLRQPYLLFIGTLQPRKNLQRVLAAFARAVTGGIAHRLVLTGQRGWLAEPLFQALERAAPAVRDRVTITGYVDDDDLPVLYNGADGLIFPSLHEGFGLPALEAMACGTPVLTSNTTSLPEVVQDAGLLVDPLDVDAIAAGMELLVAVDGPRAKLRAAGLARARHFSWERAARATLEVLRDVAEQSAGPAGRSERGVRPR